MRSLSRPLAWMARGRGELAVMPSLTRPQPTMTSAAATVAVRYFAIRDDSGTSTSSSASSSSSYSCSGGGRTPEDFKAKIRDGDKSYDPHAKVREEYPIVQLPARTLWERQFALNPRLVAAGEYADMIRRVMETRHYYQYPSLCGPQIGWNVRMFTLFDGSVFINPVNLDHEAWREHTTRQHAELTRARAAGVAHPSGSAADAFSLVPRAAPEPVDLVDQEERHMARLRQRGETCFAWEPCASCCFLLHYIERPSTVRIRALDGTGTERVHTLSGMLARFALHEMDHLDGVLFTRRVVDTDHVVPMEGFNCMSFWSDDYPSLEARSTFLYTTFTPPFTFRTESVDDANLLDRTFEDGIYPGCELDRQMRIQSVALQSIQRDRWRRQGKEGSAGGAGAAPAEALESGSTPGGATMEGF